MAYQVGSGLDTSLLLGESGLLMVRRSAIMVAIAGLVITVNSFWGGTLLWLNLAPLFATLVGCCTLVLLQRGRVRWAVATLVWGTAFTIFGICFIGSGIRTPGLAFIPILCMAAAWLLSVRSAVALASTTMALMLFFVVAERYGLVFPINSRNTVGIALIYLFTFVGAAIVAIGSTGSFRAQMQQTMDLSADLQCQVAELRKSEERFSALFRANPVPSSTNDHDGRIIDVNDAWVTLYGISTQDAIGKTAQEAGIWSDPQERKAIYEELAARGRVDGASISLRTAGGFAKPFLLYIAPVEFGGQQRLVTSMLDQTDRLAAEAAQRVVKQDLEQRVAERTAELTQTVQILKATQTELVEVEKLASLGAMVAGISHELNTPLGNAVTVSSTLLMRGAELQQAMEKGELRRSALNDFLNQQQEMTGLILRSTERAAELVRSFKQVAVDRTSERRRSFDLRSLVHDIVATFHMDLGRANVSVMEDIAPDLVCDGLPGPVGQVLTNLVQNALLHAFGGRGGGHITIRARLTAGAAHGAWVELRVSDDGVGMSEHVRHHAFDPFFTTRMGQGGSGLGLSVSHRLASSMMGGTLTVESTPGAGSCFMFCFPQNLPAAA